MTFDVASAFRDEFAKAIAGERNKPGAYPIEQWQATGRKGGIAADLDWWKENGPQMCQAYIDWHESTPGLSVWTTPDGQPAIELDLKVKFGPIPVHVRIDVVYLLGTALVITDHKSGAKQPDNLRQLGIGASAIELAYGIRPRYGTHFMVRGVGRKNGEKRYFLQPTELSGYQYSVEYLTKQFEALDRAAEAGIFVANPGEQCGRCSVASACPETTGRKG